MKEENNEICPKWWQPGISLQKISHGNRTCQMSRGQITAVSPAPASSGYSGQEIRGDRGERSGGSAIVPAMRSDAGGYQEDTATQPPPPAQGYWRPAGAGAGLPADAEAACCCCAGAGAVLGLCWIELQTKVREDFTIKERAPASTFTFKKLC